MGALCARARGGVVLHKRECGAGQQGVLCLFLVHTWKDLSSEPQLYIANKQDRLRVSLTAELSSRRALRAPPPPPPPAGLYSYLVTDHGRQPALEEKQPKPVGSDLTCSHHPPSHPHPACTPIEASLLDETCVSEDHEEGAIKLNSLIL